MKLIQWFRENFQNDDIVSALSGAEVEPPFFDADRKLRAQVWTFVSYLAIFTVMIYVSVNFVAEDDNERDDPLPGLVFVMEEGPGGGGGGSGETPDEPAAQLEVQGEDVAALSVAVEPPEEELIFDDPDKPNEIEEPEEEVAEEAVIEVEAPIVAMATDDANQEGELEGIDDPAASPGRGTGGGIGEGTGTGLGDGTGGGTGGGAYRIGSGVTSPIPIKQVRPTFTDEALARKIQGEVVVEVIILADGSVKPVRVLQGLGADLNAKALEAAAGWKFIPGKFKGKPVDVIAELVVAFNIL